MKFGSKFNKETATASESSDVFARTFKNGETEVRFLDEMEDGHKTGPWTLYGEHFDQENQRSYPCLGSKSTCPGCASENERERRATKRYLANALHDGYVNLYKVPQSLINTLMKYNDKDGGITKRDFVVSREGTGLKTEYSVFAEDRSQIDISAFKDQMIDHQTILAEMFREVWGKSPEEISEMMEEGDYPRKAIGQQNTAKNSVRKPEKKAEKAKSTKKDAWAKEESEDIEYSREELLEMSKKQLKRVYDQAKIEWPEGDGWDREDFVDHLIDAVEVPY